MQYFMYVIRHVYSAIYLDEKKHLTKDIFEAKKFDTYKECKDFISDEIDEAMQLDYEIVRYRFRTSIVEEEVM